MDNNRDWKISDILVAIALTILSIVIAAILEISISEFSNNISFLKLADLVLDIFIFLPGTIYLQNKYPLKKGDFSLYYLNKIRPLLYGIQGGLLLIIINNVVISEILKKQPLFINEMQKTLELRVGPVGLLYLLFAVILVPIIEEIAFRGFLYRILRNRFNVIVGVLVCTALYAANHILIIPAIINSFILIYVYEKGKTLASNIFAHVIYNASAYIFILTI